MTRDVIYCLCAVLDNGAVSRGCLTKSGWESIRVVFDNQDGCWRDAIVDGELVEGGESTAVRG